MGRKVEVEYTEEFESWWDRLTEGEQERIDAMVNLLRKEGTALGYPRSSQVKTSRHSHMRELRVTTAGRAIRIFYAFDPRRTAILLIGGRKTEQERFYEEYVRRADSIYDEYLSQIRHEGLLEPDRGSTRRR